jgi:hypothetical protein
MKDYAKYLTNDALCVSRYNWNSTKSQYFAVNLTVPKITGDE